MAATQALGLDPKQPDRFITSDPNHWIRIRWWVCPRGAVSALCPARGDVFPGDASPFGYTIESIQEQKRDDATCFLVTTYLKPKIRSQLLATGVYDEASKTVITATEDFFKPWMAASVASTLDGAPVKDNGTSTVTVDDPIFYEDCVGEDLTIGENTYVVASVTSTTVCVVTGDASGEADEAACSLSCYGKTITVDDTGSYAITDYVSATVVKVAGNHAFSGKQFTVSGALMEMRRRVTRHTQRGNFAIRTFVCDEDYVETRLTSATDFQVKVDQLYPDDAGQMWGSYCYNINVEHDTRPGIAYVTAYYQPADRNGALERNPGTGILEVAWLPSKNRLAKDQNGDPVSKVFYSAADDEVQRWHPVQGTPEAVEFGVCLFRLSVVLTALPLTLINNLIGKINNGALAAFGDCGGQGKLLFLPPDPPARQLYRNDTLYLVSFNLAFCGKNWNQTIPLQLQKKEVYAIPVLKLDGTSAGGRTRDIEIWTDKSGDGTTGYAIIATEADFSTLNGYLA